MFLHYVTVLDLGPCQRSGGPSGTGKVALNPVFPPPTYDEPNKPSSQTNLVPPPTPSTSFTTQFPPVGSSVSKISRSSSSGSTNGITGSGGQLERCHGHFPSLHHHKMGTQSLRPPTPQWRFLQRCPRFLPLQRPHDRTRRPVRGGTHRNPERWRRNGLPRQHGGQRRARVGRVERGGGIGGV
jgi:hypothetical protein